MAVLRSANLLGQGRLDIPHLRAIESSICADFDVLAGDIMAGHEAVVVNGFTVLAIDVGASVIGLKIRTANATIIHPEASESGSIFKVPGDRADETMNAANARVNGGFTASTTNYIGIDLRRTADPTTADLVQFLDPDTNKEKPKTVPLARTLDYVFVISTQGFSTTPGIAPIAKVVTDAFNNVVSVEDARNFFCRLGTGGDITDTQHAYTWPGGRSEVGNNSDFSAGDKVIGSLKEWMDAAMTRLWELGGGEHWYSPTADRNVKLLRTGPTFTNGEWFEWSGTNLHWKGLTFLFDNSTGSINEILNQTTNSPGLTDLADGDCIYVDVDRAEDKTGVNALQPVKSTLLTLSYPIVPGSRFIIAWRSGSSIFTRDTSFPVGASFRVATDTITGIVQLTYPAGNVTLPLVMPQDANGSMHNDATGGNGYGLAGTGTGSGAGVVGTGGSTGYGVIGYAAVGGSGHGVLGQALAASLGDGVHGIGDGTGSGGVFTGGAANGNGVSGTGTGTGIGVLGVSGTAAGANPAVEGQAGLGSLGIGVRGIGDTYGAGGYFTGGSDGSAVELNQVVNDYQPLLKIKDSDGNQREVIDNTGFMNMGRVTTFEENWVGPGFFYDKVSFTNRQIFTNGPTDLTPLLWNIASAGGGSVGFSAALVDDTTIGGPVVQIAPVDGDTDTVAKAGARAEFYTVSSVVTMNTTRVVAAEWEGKVTNGVFGGFTNLRCFFGLSGTPTDAALDASNCALFTCDAQGGASTNWNARVSNGATPTDVDTGVARTLATWFRFRFEIHGAATPVGVANAGVMTTKFFINNALVATIAKTITGSLTWVFGAKSVDQVGTDNGDGWIFSGPLMVKWNRYENTVL